MCGIAGFYDRNAHYQNHPAYFESILKKMTSVLRHRGPDENGIYLSDSCGLAHARLSIIDLQTGQQPMRRSVGGYDYAIVYNGELYNTAELKQDLLAKGWRFETTSDTEVILLGFIEYGAAFVTRLNGIFAFAVIDERSNSIYLFRDRLGVKPLFYSFVGDTLVFSSEIKGLFVYPQLEPEVDINGLNEIFSIGPAKTYGCGVFKGVKELLPGHYLQAGDNGKRLVEYWRLESKPHEDSFANTVEKTSFLVADAIRRQMVSDVPICTFLSGGVDSSLVSAVCATELQAAGKQLHTFSFDFAGNEQYFKPNSFQPTQDRYYVEKMVAFLHSEHHFLECNNTDLADFLYTSVDARDLPAMADVDSSLLYFCSLVKQHNKVALTGECADEIFGGYPWFHKPEFFTADTFPWTPDLEARKVLLSDAFLDELKMEEYVRRTYEKSVAETPQLAGETPEEARRREISYLNLKWFMQTLLDRMDRSSMYFGLEARVPFADHRIVEYIWNVPWVMKTPDGMVKGLLREAARGLLPDEILFRRKSPYPKTYNPEYENLLKQRFIEIIEDASSPILPFIDKHKVARFFANPSDYGKPWYGQLMAGPQMIAYLIQVNYWLSKYRIKIV